MYILMAMQVVDILPVDHTYNALGIHRAPCYDMGKSWAGFCKEVATPQRYLELGI
jgi:hypothetical protein